MKQLRENQIVIAWCKEDGGNDVGGSLEASIIVPNSQRDQSQRANIQSWTLVRLNPAYLWMRNNTMHLTFFFLSFTCAAEALSAADPAPVNSSLQLYTFLSAVPHTPDEQWSGVSAYRPPSVAAVPTMMALVQAIHALAPLEPLSSLTTEQRWTHPNFPGVVVSMQGSKLTTARFGMWIIVFAMRDMLMRDRFQMSYFIGRWQGLRVAALHIEPAGFVDGEAGKQQHDSTDSTERLAVTKAAEEVTKASSSRSLTSIFSVSRNDSSLLVPSLTDDELMAYVHYLSTPIDRKDMFMAIVWLILALSPFYHDPLYVFRCNVDAIGAEIPTIWNRVRDPAAPLIGGDVINMIARLSEVLLRENKFFEMNIDMSEDGVLVGKGAMRVGPKPRKPTLRNTATS
ncbi:MAG: hypothetical protein Q9173_004940 [Seirophora scorigena]